MRVSGSSALPGRGCARTGRPAANNTRTTIARRWDSMDGKLHQSELFVTNQDSLDNVAASWQLAESTRQVANLPPHCVTASYTRRVSRPDGFVPSPRAHAPRGHEN